MARMLPWCFSNLLLMRTSPSSSSATRGGKWGSCVFSSVSGTIMMGFSVSIAQVFFFQTIISLIDAICYPLKWSIFTKIIDSNNQELEWSLEDVLSTLASATLAALGGYLTNWYGLTVIFIFFGISYSLSGLSFYFIKMKRHQHIF